MNFSEALSIALRSLRANKLRSALTTLGIIIGVSAVIVLVGLGDGMKAGFNKSFGALATAIIVTKIEGSVPGAGAPRDLKDSDVTALRNRTRAPAVATVIPGQQGPGVFQMGPGNTFGGTIFGSTTDYLSVSNREVTAGEMFTEQDMRSNAKVTLIGPDVVKNLYGGNDQAAVGSSMKIGRSTFKVIGTLKSDGNMDDLALMPLTTARSYLLGGNNTVTTMAVKAVDVQSVNAAVQQITTILSERHNIREKGKEDFKVTALQSQLDKITQFMGFLTLFIVAVAGISLIVGAIGVANIMLVSVTERTREIGIRKAIGARRSAIMKQFLMESTVLAGLGGLVGIVIGAATVIAGSIIIPRLTPDFGAPQVSAPAIAVAFGVSLVIGLVAGGYPAWRASRLQPIEALRFQ
jgi:putative ABC transport system permease protein